MAIRNAKVLLDIRAMFVGLMMDARCDADGGLFTFHLLQETDPQGADVEAAGEAQDVLNAAIFCGKRRSSRTYHPQSGST